MFKGYKELLAPVVKAFKALKDFKVVKVYKV